MMNIITILSYNLFSAGQIAVIVLISVALAAAIGLNGWLIYLLHKRGEHRLQNAQLQKQREALLNKLEAMREGKDVDVAGDIADKFSFTVVSSSAAPSVEEEDEEENVVTDEADEDEYDDETEVIDLEVDSEGKVIRYNRSFTARVIQSDNDLKARYSELKNYVLSYKGVKSRVSWKKETFHKGRKSYVSFVIRGKTLCVCLATDAKLFDGTKYKVDDLSSAKTKNPTPCRFRITSDRKTAYAKELIDIVMAGFGVERLDEYVAQDFTSPYKSTQALVKRRLIKIMGDSVPDFAKEDALAASRRVRYNRSFEARIIQSDDELKGYYSVLKNYLLSYDGMIVKNTWKKESFLIKRNVKATFVIKGKTLCICLDLDPKHFEGTKYKVEDLSLRVKNTKTPLLYRIKNTRRLQYAQTLIDLSVVGEGVEKVEKESVNYAVPFVSTETLVRRGLIKEVALSKKEIQKLEEKEAAAAKAREVSLELPKRTFETVKEVTVDEATEKMSDEQAQKLIEEVEVVVTRKAFGNKRGTVNIDILSQNYQAGELVTVENMHEKNLIPNKVGRVKVLADGLLDKPLIVEADDFSVEAVKMIVLTGGRAIKSKAVKE